MVALCCFAPLWCFLLAHNWDSVCLFACLFVSSEIERSWGPKPNVGDHLADSAAKHWTSWIRDFCKILFLCSITCVLKVEQQHATKSRHVWLFIAKKKYRILNFLKGCVKNILSRCSVYVGLLLWIFEKNKEIFRFRLHTCALYGAGQDLAGKFPRVCWRGWNEPPPSSSSYSCWHLWLGQLL